jgi:hypothetical protein
MPQATLRISIDDREETLSEYMCDWPDCRNPGVHVFAVVSLRLRAIMCPEHAAEIANRGKS